LEKIVILRKIEKYDVPSNKFLKEKAPLALPVFSVYDSYRVLIHRVYRLLNNESSEKSPSVICLIASECFFKNKKIHMFNHI